MSWIPVEERLPQVGWWYIPVTFWNGKTGVARYVSTTDEWYDVNGGVCHVIAWQPLPAPYVKPRRFVVEEYFIMPLDGRTLFGVCDGALPDREPAQDRVAYRIPTREAAETIANVYEEAYRGQ